MKKTHIDSNHTVIVSPTMQKLFVVAVIATAIVPLIIGTYFTLTIGMTSGSSIWLVLLTQSAQAIGPLVYFAVSLVFLRRQRSHKTTWLFQASLLSYITGSFALVIANAMEIGLRQFLSGSKDQPAVWFGAISYIFPQVLGLIGLIGYFLVQKKRAERNG